MGLAISKRIIEMHGGPTAIDVLDRRLARGEIDRAEYEEKRKLIGR